MCDLEKSMVSIKNLEQQTLQVFINERRLKIINAVTQVMKRHKLFLDVCVNQGFFVTSGLITEGQGDLRRMGFFFHADLAVSYEPLNHDDKTFAAMPAQVATTMEAICSDLSIAVMDSFIRNRSIYPNPCWYRFPRKENSVRWHQYQKGGRSTLIKDWLIYMQPTPKLAEVVA